MKRSIACTAITLLCATTLFAQTRRTAKPASTSPKPGYYFTVDMCRACYYAKWEEDIVRLFQEKGISAAIYEGAMMESPTERFASLKIFPRRGLWGDIVYVGPFASDKAALDALDKFPAVLGFVQKKRNKMDAPSQEPWPVSADEKVQPGKGNDYRYGFFEIKGCRLVA